MKIQKFDTLSFQSYKNILKTSWKQGKLPSVKRGLYGDILTLNNVSLEHITPHSLGGKTELQNLALASVNKNNERGTSPLKYFLTWDKINQYLSQFKDIKIEYFNGNEYIKNIIETLKRNMI